MLRDCHLSYFISIFTILQSMAAMTSHYTIPKCLLLSGLVLKLMDSEATTTCPGVSVQKSIQ